MSTYTLSGYLSALAVRENRTVLVEGRDDKSVVARIMLEFETNGASLNHATVVDSAELVRGDDEPMGNRAIVELVHARCRTEGRDIAAVVDREFREFSFAAVPSDTLNEHVVVDSSLFWTLGHSIENYFFEPRYPSAFIKSQFAEHLGASCIPSCEMAYEGVLVWASAAGLGLWECKLLEKSRGIGKYSHWNVGAVSAVNLDVDAYCTAFSKRGVVQADIQRLSSRIRHWHNALKSVVGTAAHRIAHGHVAYEMIWCGLAAVLLNAGSTQTCVDGVAYGYKDAKWRKLADELAKAVWNGKADVLPKLWAKLYSSTPTRADWRPAS